MPSSTPGATRAPATAARCGSRGATTAWPTVMSSRSSSRRRLRAVRGDRVAEAGQLGRLWPVVDPALDELGTTELLAAVLDALGSAFAAPAVAVELDDGERVGTDRDDPLWDTGPRLVLPVSIASEEI